MSKNYQNWKANLIKKGRKEVFETLKERMKEQIDKGRDLFTASWVLTEINKLEEKK